MAHSVIFSLTRSTFEKVGIAVMVLFCSIGIKIPDLLCDGSSVGSWIPHIEPFILYFHRVLGNLILLLA